RRRPAAAGDGGWGSARGRPPGGDGIGGGGHLGGGGWSLRLCARRCVGRSPTSSRSAICTRRRTTAGAPRRALPCARSPMLAGPPRPRMRVELIVNGEMRTVEIEPRVSLLDCLRHRLFLTPAHPALDHALSGPSTLP